MSLSSSLKDVGRSCWDGANDYCGNTAKIVGAAAVGGMAMVATTYILDKACNYFRIPHTENALVVPGPLAAVGRNRLIIDVAILASGLIAPALVPMEFKSFSLSQNVQFAAVDLLMYGAAKAAFRGDALVETNGFLLFMLSRPITGIALSNLRDYSGLPLPVFIAAWRFAELNNQREHRVADENAGNTLSARFRTASQNVFRWLTDPVHPPAAAAVEGPGPVLADELPIGQLHAA